MVEPKNFVDDVAGGCASRDHFFGDLDWAPSGRTLVIKAFTATDPPTNIELWLVDVSSRKAKRLTHTPLDEAVKTTLVELKCL